MTTRVVVERGCKTNGGMDIYWPNRWTADRFSELVGGCDIEEYENYVIYIYRGDIRYRMEARDKENIAKAMKYLRDRGVEVDPVGDHRWDELDRGTL